MNRDDRRRRGEIREERGLATINQYGGVWSFEIFETREAARAFLFKEWPGADMDKFRLAMAVRTIEVYRPLGDAITTPMSRE